MGDEGVVDLLVAVERLLGHHRDELDALNVFPVPDADTGRNVLATVRSARAGAEQAERGDARAHAVRGAVQGARGNAGVLTSQLLRGLLETDGDWAARLRRADELAREAVAHPVEGSFLTAVRAAADASAGATGEAAQLRAATDAAHAAVRDSPTQLEVLARAGVVDAGARAAALVLEAVTAHLAGAAPAPPTVDVPVDGPQLAACADDDARFEVMYLLTPHGDDVVAPVRAGLDRIGGSVVVVAADQLLSVHVHTDDIGAALDVGLSHGRPHDIRVEDLREGMRAAAARRGAPAVADVTGPGLVVGADGDGIAQLAAATGATTLPLAGAVPGPDEVAAAAARTGATHVVLLPSSPELAVTAHDVPGVTVVPEVDGPARLLAALAMLAPGRPDVAGAAAAAEQVREGAVVEHDGAWATVVDGAHGSGHDDPVAALEALLDLLAPHGEPELVTLLLGHEVRVAQADAAAGAVQRRWPGAELDVVDVRLHRAVFAVGCE